MNYTPNQNEQNEIKEEESNLFVEQIKIRNEIQPAHHKKYKITSAELSSGNYND